MKEENIIFGRNPVLTVLRNKPTQIEKIYLRYGVEGKPIDDIIYLSRKNSVPFSFLDKEKFKKIENEIQVPQTQGVIAYLSLIEYLELYELIDIAFQKEKQPILVFLEKIQDPQNLGSIARTAECVGAQGLILTTKKTAPINSTVVKASTGAILNLPIVKVDSTIETIEDLKKFGFWIIGTTPKAEIDFWDFNYDVPIVVIFGSEGRGLSQSTLKHCDAVIKIPIFGKTESLNASVSAAIILYEIRRQRSLSVPK
ncbi:MAG: 23S rRNA (guanosine(2251)-2'-O)-methyltransferase RlmB [Ignavibacteria bacterium]|nr:23S rRNA (guanosine(2251)-2'-O)-methyltransferase RlmB [Ignavibacteria bacterium]